MAGKGALEPTAADRGLRSDVAAILGVLVCTTALLPFFTESALLLKVLRHLMAAALVVAIWLDSGKRAVPIFVTSIAAFEVAALWAPLDTDLAVQLRMQLLLAFLMTNAGYLMHRIWTMGEVGISTLIVATGLYFLLGLCWNLVFSLVEMHAPGSFAHACLPGGGDVGGCVRELGQFPRLAYFSFVTLTTLGYGDVVPLTRPAEGLAIAAAVTGQLFMAVLIGRLVGSYLSQRGPRPIDVARPR